MTEENQINSSNYKNLLLNNKKSLIILILFLLISLFAYFFYIDYKKDIKVQISEKYNLAIINYNKDSPNLTLSEMKNIINSKDPTYSPLALYFLLDNNLLIEKNEINKYFDILIYNVDLDKEIKNLVIYKKGLFNSNSATEAELLDIFKPLLNNENMWKSHALYILAEYFFSKNEKQKSKEFFSQILDLENANQDLRIESQKRLNRDLSD